MKTSALLGFLLCVAPDARADFGEIDLMVRESVEAHFRGSGKAVEMNRFEYRGRPRHEGDHLLVNSVVWAEQDLIAPHWGWHGCTTELQILPGGAYRDLGSDCAFEFD